MESENVDIKTISEVFKDFNLQNQRTRDENEFWKKQEFVDVIVKSKDGTEFKVHKIVLASGCPYFKALFHSGMKESNQKIIQLDHDITGRDLEKLLTYIYTGEIELSVEKAKIFCEYALYFQLINLKDFCGHTLSKSLNLENCLELWAHGVKYLNDTLIRLCLKFIIEKCSNIVQTNFFQLKDDLYEEIIMIAQLSDIEKLYLFIYNWIIDSFKERNIFLNGLIKYFRFSLLSNNFLKDYILQDKKLLTQKEFSKKFCEIFENKFGISSNKETFAHILPEKTHYFVSNKKIWMLINEKYEIFENGKTVIGCQAHIYDYNTLFLSGGSHYKNCFYFCPSSKKLEVFPSMAYGRHNHSVIELNKKLYALGGQTNKTVEIFDINDEKWYDGPQLIDKTESIGLTTWENSVYLFGSFDKYKCSTSVERYDPNENKFTIVCEAPPIRSTKAVRIDDIVYCFNWEGGYKFNLRTNKWFEKIPKAPVQWTSIESAVLFKNYIAVLGVLNGVSTLYFLDPIKNIWANDLELKLESEDIIQFV